MGSDRDRAMQRLCVAFVDLVCILAATVGPADRLHDAALVE